MTWRSPLAALLIVVGLILSLLRAVATTIPTLIAYDVAVEPTATVRVDAEPWRRLEGRSATAYAYDEVFDRCEGISAPPVAAGTGSARAYDGALEVTERRVLADGAIYDAAAEITAAEGSTALVEGGEVWNARGGIDFSKSTAFEGQVQIPYTGSRMLDYQAANQAAGLGDSMRAPAGFVWHHLDDYNALTNTGTMQLVDQAAHMANAPHIGGVAQWVEWMGVPYAP